MPAESRRQFQHVATLPRVFISGKGWYTGVEIRVEWTETRIAEGFPFRADKHYVRAYANDRIIDHVFEPYKTVGAAKTGCKRFIQTLEAYAIRAERSDPGRMAG